MSLKPFQQRPGWQDFAIAALASSALAVSVVGGQVAHNLNDVWRGELLRPLLLLPAFFTALCMAVWRLGGSRQALFSLPALVFLLFSFHFTVNEIVMPLLFMPESWYQHYPGLINVFLFLPHFTLLLLLLAFLCYLGLLRLGEPRKLSLVVLAFALGSAAPVLQPLAQVLTQGNKVGEPVAPAELVQQLAAARPQGPLPDIVLVVPDRYPSARVLRENYGHDNAAFLTALRERGFLVHDDMRANYPFTVQSLSSSFNLAYLQPDRADNALLHSALHNSLLARTLLRLGYEYVHGGGWWSGTRYAPLATEVYNGTRALEAKLNTLELVLAGLSPALGLYRTWSESQYGEGPDASATYECRRLQRQLHKMRTLDRGEQPLFALFHIYIPHNPITMNIHGDCVPSPMSFPTLDIKDTVEPEKTRRIKQYLAKHQEYRRAFVEYMYYLNGELLEIFDAQRARSHAAGRGLVFVIQADEGPYSAVWAAGSNNVKYRIVLRDLPDRVLRMKFGILSAVYADGVERRRLCEIEAPVDTWRVLLGDLLGLELSTLGARLFGQTALYGSEEERRILPLDESLLGPTEPYADCAVATAQAGL